MRALHLFSNYKWTGPAEPAVTLVAGLRAAGVEALLRSSGTRPRGAVDFLRAHATERGVPPVLDLHLGKHRRWLRDTQDARRLAALLVEERHDLVHTHQVNDMRIAARACRRLARQGVQPPPLVRTVYDTDPTLFGTHQGRLVARHAAAVLVFSTRMARHLVACGVNEDRLARIDTCVDLERFSPSRELPDLRGEYGFESGDFLAGIVARVQPQRRFDLLLDMAEQVVAQHPRFKLLIIGRGSHLDEVARDPARARGLLDRVVYFPGYLSGDRYVALLRCLDVKLFLVPGTDGTARAVREALALGLPVLCTRRGMLEELVQDGVTGFLCDETPAAFADAVSRLARDHAQRARLGQAAATYARAHFALGTQVRQVVEVYERLLTRS